MLALAALLGAGALLALELVLSAVGAVIAYRFWRRVVGGPALPRKVRRMFGLNLTSIGLKLLGVLGVVVAIYWVGHSAGVSAEQKREDKAVTPICEAVGATWVEVDGNGKPLRRAKWGDGCLTAAKALAKFKTDTQAASSKAVVDHETDEARKTAADVATAQKIAKAVAAARRKMEKTNAAVKDDRVDGGWFADLNDVGGLRGSSEGRADRPLQKPADQPPY